MCSRFGCTKAYHLQCVNQEQVSTIALVRWLCTGADRSMGVSGTLLRLL
jgi:hypothetical protein